jgi:hypothetical protein
VTNVAVDGPLEYVVLKQQGSQGETREKPMAWEFRYDVDENPCEICLGAVLIESKREGSAEGLDPDDPAALAAIDRVRWELEMLGQ